MKTIRIKPRNGVELAGIPAAGADVPEALAREWIAARLATAVNAPTPKPARNRPPRPVATAHEEG